MCGGGGHSFNNFWVSFQWHGPTFFNSDLRTFGQPSSFCGLKVQSACRPDSSASPNVRDACIVRSDSRQGFLVILYVFGLAKIYILRGTPRTYAIKTRAVTDN